MWCDACRSTGAIHCAMPDECGNMLSATAAADNWKAWLDDLPLPFTFDPAIGRLQDFITGLTARIEAQAGASAALAQTPTDPGDGWTWNERLGWIGPDGKPADPQGRG